MSRPLILKVVSHNSQPNHKATGSINVALLPEKENRTTYSSSDINYIHTKEEQLSLVQSLVSKYETPSSSTLNKYKSKSMSDLHPYKLQEEINKEQSPVFYQKTNHSPDETFEIRQVNFQHALNKFKGASKDAALKQNEKEETATIREQAQHLLHSNKHDYFWFNQVVQLLQQIVSDPTYYEKSAKDKTVDIAAPTEKHIQQVHNAPRDKTPLKVSEMTQRYEEKVVQKPKLTVEPTQNINHSPNLYVQKQNNEKTEQKQKVPLKYFGKEDEDSDESTLTDTEERYIDDKPVETALLSKNRTEPKGSEIQNGDHNVSDEIDKTLLVQTEETIETILRTIEECEKEIENISIENKTEAVYLNEILLQVLLKLDDLKTYDNRNIMSMKKMAFGQAQDCIKQLKNKVLNDNDE